MIALAKIPCSRTFLPMKFLPLVLIFSLAAGAWLFAQEPAKPGETKPPEPKPADLFEARTFGGPHGETLGYRLLKPEPYDPAQKYPLVLFLHGAGERGTDNAIQVRIGAELFIKPDVRARFPCFVLAPQCPPEQKWADIDWTIDAPKQPEKLSPSMALAVGAVDEVSKEFSIDPDRLYVTGLSMGGYGTWDLATRMPEKWAAAVPICGGGDPTVAPNAKALAIWAFHGMEDKIVKVVRSRSMIAALKSEGARPLYSEYPYIGHDSWNVAYKEPELLNWLFAQRRGQPPVDFVTVAGPFAQPPSEEFPGAGPVQSSLWFRGVWKDKRTQWAKDSAADQGAVVFFGDSITQGWNSLATDFPQLKVANRGIGGDTTRGLRGRLKEILDLHPRAVSMLIGTNDLDQGAEPAVVAANLRAIVAEFHATYPSMPIVINKVMPRGARPGKFPEKIRELNGLYEAAFQNDPMITFCDTFALFDAGDGQCKKEEFPDMLHPNPAGYAKWTTALTPIFEKLKVGK